MVHKLQIEIDCGDENCVSELKRWCRFLGSKAYEPVPICLLFPSDGRAYTVLDNSSGLPKRCLACLEHDSTVQM